MRFPRFLSTRVFGPRVLALGLAATAGIAIAALAPAPQAEARTNVSLGFGFNFPVYDSWDYGPGYSPYYYRHRYYRPYGYSYGPPPIYYAPPPVVYAPPPPVVYAPPPVTYVQPPVAYNTPQYSAPYRAENGQYCREYRSKATIEGKVQDLYGTACQQPDGTWR